LGPDVGLDVALDVALALVFAGAADGLLVFCGEGDAVVDVETGCPSVEAIRTPSFS
jgi:hypothetical protein